MESVLVTTIKLGGGKWFESLWQEQELTDVTLVCKDGLQLMAHKTVLALSSPLLKTILTRSKRPDPVLLLVSTDALVLERLLRLIYFGEVSLPAGELNRHRHTNTNTSINTNTNTNTNANTNTNTNTNTGESPCSRT